MTEQHRDPIRSDPGQDSAATPDQSREPAGPVRRRRWVLGSIVSVAVVGIVLLVFLLPDLLLSNLPWSTYTSDHLGYSMSIPDSWIVAENEDRDDWQFGEAELVVARVAVPPGVTGEVTESDARDLASSRSLELTSFTTTTLDGTAAYLIAMRGPAANPVFALALFSVRDHMLWALTWSDAASREADSRESFERIRTSFHVVDEAAPSGS